MKKFCIALIGLTLLEANSLLGQAPMPAPGIPTAAPAVVIQEGAPCGRPQTTCVPEHYLKKTTKVVYSKDSVPLCLCFFRGLFKGCGCESGHCEHPYTRHYLVKKTQTCETDAVKCVPSQASACDHGCCSFGSAPASAVVAPSMAPAMVQTPVQPVMTSLQPAR